MCIIEDVYDNTYCYWSNCKCQGEPLISREGTATRFSNSGGESSDVCRQFELYDKSDNWSSLMIKSSMRFQGYHAEL